MKILVVTQYFYPEDFKVNDAVEHLIKSGYEVRVLTAFPNYPSGSFFDGYRLFDTYPKHFKGARIYRAPIFPRKRSPISLILNYLSFPLTARIYSNKIKKEFNPDVVLGFQLSPIWSMLPAVFLRRRFNIPFLLWCLDLWPESYLSNFSYRNKIIDGWVRESSERIYKSADTLAVTTKSFVESLAEATGRTSKEIHHLPNWAEDSYLKPPEDSFSFNNESFNIVFAGNIGESQGLDIVLKAARETVDTNIVWHLFGDGRYEVKLRKEADVFKISNLVFHGRVTMDKLPSIYREANALLLTLKPNQGYSNTMPGKFAGYLTSGTPILSNIQGEVRKIIESNGLGFTFDNDEKELVNQVRELKSMIPVDLEQIKISCRNYYDKHFSKPRVLSDLEKLLIDLKE
ncbi:glycosyltransferase family 4 protein [Schleiferiaceae bacterium]|nr:glycosyltransferase family 4 protein [Schleiferiaceae bacterium]